MKKPASLAQKTACLLLALLFAALSLPAQLWQGGLLAPGVNVQVATAIATSDDFLNAFSRSSTPASGSSYEQTADIVINAQYLETCKTLNNVEYNFNDYSTPSRPGCRSPRAVHFKTMAPKPGTTWVNGPASPAKLYVCFPQVCGQQLLGPHLHLLHQQ